MVPDLSRSAAGFLSTDLKDIFYSSSSSLNNDLENYYDCNCFNINLIFSSAYSVPANGFSSWLAKPNSTL